jgi:hypothetical protein
VTQMIFPQLSLGESIKHCATMVLYSYGQYAKMFLQKNKITFVEKIETSLHTSPTNSSLSDEPG